MSLPQRVQSGFPVLLAVSISRRQDLWRMSGSSSSGMGSRTVSDGAIVSNADRLDPRRSDPCVVSSPITVTSGTVGHHGSGLIAASPVCLRGHPSSFVAYHVCDVFERHTGGCEYRSAQLRSGDLSVLLDEELFFHGPTNNFTKVLTGWFGHSLRPKELCDPLHEFLDFKGNALSHHCDHCIGNLMWRDVFECALGSICSSETQPVSGVLLVDPHEVPEGCALNVRIIQQRGQAPDPLFPNRSKSEAVGYAFNYRLKLNWSFSFDDLLDGHEGGLVKRLQHRDRADLSWVLPRPEGLFTGELQVVSGRSWFGNDWGYSR